MMSSLVNLDAGWQLRAAIIVEVETKQIHINNYELPKTVTEPLRISLCVLKLNN